MTYKEQYEKEMKENFKEYSISLKDFNEWLNKDNNKEKFTERVEEIKTEKDNDRKEMLKYYLAVDYSITRATVDYYTRQAQQQTDNTQQQTTHTQRERERTRQ